MKIRTAILLVFLIITNSGKCFASSFEKGMSFYRKENYLGAKKYLEKASEKDRNNWRVHYYLGNTCLALGKFETARQEYETAQKLCVKDEHLKLCVLARLAVEKYIVKSQIAFSNLRESTREATEKIETARETCRERIKKEAEKQVSVIRKQAQEQIAAEKSCSQLILRYEDGTTALGISPLREAQIKADAESQCQILKQTAQSSIDSIK